MRVLVTGFGPYPGVPRNPTSVLARDISADRRLRRLGIAARSVTFATTYGSIRNALAEVLDDAAPDVCLHLGLAPRSGEVRVERRGENRCRPLFPDAQGGRPRARALVPDGPAALPSSADPARAVSVLRRHGIAARVSGDAGAYLCNAAYYLSLEAGRRDAGRLVLFVHIPRPAAAPGRVPSRRARRDRPTLPALRTALLALVVDLARDARVRPAAPPA